MKNSKVIAVWFYLFLILGIAACGGSEGIVNSSSSNTEATASNNQTSDDGDSGVHHFDTPIGNTGGGN